MFFKREPKTPGNDKDSTSKQQADGVEEAVALFNAKQAESFEELQANKPTVMVVGRAGAGKSTLVNAVFGRKVAKPGTGRPVTQNYTLYSEPDTLVNLYDTRGWEGGADDEKLFYADTKSFLSKRDILPPDIIWYVVEGPGARFTDYDKQIIRDLFSDRMVIVVITKSDIAHTEQIDSLKQAIRNANLSQVVDTVAVAAEPTPSRSSRGRDRRHNSQNITPSGLKDLVGATKANLAESRQMAFVAAQKADLEEKDRMARQIVIKSTMKAASVSVGGAFVPVPFAEAPFLVGIQMHMLAQIANVYEVGIDLSQIVGAFVTQTLATEVGKTVAAEALKVAVGLGTAVSAVIKGSVAGSITMSIGFTFRSLYHAIAQHGLDGQLEMVDESWVKSFLQTTFQKVSLDIKKQSKYEEYDYK